ncbi:hypothetical protein ACFY12_07475 [Streptomyces sp. NPDC001339]|uniref:hypothetical protein n=1 Tax=Streptomyces sp. NPDC001339 TaxID=3364563 RepID=UPI0036B1F92F
MLVDHLRSHPDQAFTATRISRIIGRHRQHLGKPNGQGIAGQAVTRLGSSGSVSAVIDV